MRVLLISCLLIGSITCGPVAKGYSSNSADTTSMRQPFPPGSWFNERGVSSDLGSSSSLPSQDVFYSPGLSSYSGANKADGMVFDSSYINPEVGDGIYTAGYSGSASAYEGDSSYGFVAASQDENRSSGSATGYSAENPEPVFSDVSDLEPVYSFSSRSRYQRGRAVFAQTRYTPGEPIFPPMPVARRYSKTTQESSPADAPPKGGF